MEKPCPFCANTKLIVVRARTSHWVHFVRCEICGAEGPNVKEDASLELSEQRAIEDWNTRS